MKDSKSVLQFKEYIVKNINFECNLEYDNAEPIDVKIDMDASFDINHEDMAVILKVDIFNDQDKKKYPFSMNLEIVGYYMSITKKVKHPSGLWMLIYLLSQGGTIEDGAELLHYC